MFAGKNALVTGGNNGIGAAIALGLARNGANVAIAYLNDDTAAAQVVEQIKGMGRISLAVKADVTKAERVKQYVDESVQAFGGVIDILVNNAGHMLRRVSIMDMNEELFDQVFAVNVKSTFLVTKAAVPCMSRGGRIINMSSQAGYDGGGVGSGIYATAKGAILTLTRAMAREFAPRGITVNAVAPGFIAKTAFHTKLTLPEAQAAMIERTPLKRSGSPGDGGAVPSRFRCRVVYHGRDHRDQWRTNYGVTAMHRCK
jgi:3-oxoacyl-[acyl-carrier protein] reductase